MSSTSLLASARRLAIVAAVAGAALAAPGSASAFDGPVYCVNAQSCPSGGTSANLTGALAAAENDGAHSTIVVGPNPNGAYTGAFSHTSATAANGVDIVGQGRPVLASSAAGGTVLTVTGPAHSSIDGIDVHVSALPDAGGLMTKNARVKNVKVSGGGSPLGVTRGIYALGDTEVVTSSIDMQTGLGVDSEGKTLGVTDSIIKAPTAIVAETANVFVERSRLHAVHDGMTVIGTGGEGTDARPRGLTMRSSEVTTADAQANGIEVSTAPTDLRRVTVAGRNPSPGGDSTGIAISAANADTSTFIGSSVIGGFAVPVERTVKDGHKAPLGIQDSEWEQARERVGTVAEAGALIRGAFSDRAPGFVGRQSGDLRLVGGDPAIDLHAKPNALDPVHDIDFRANRDGDGDGIAEADAGAYEYDGPPPAPKDDGGDDTQAPASGPSPAAKPPGSEERPAPGATPPGTGPSRDTTAPQVLSARLRRRGGKLRLRVDLSERATLRIRVLKLKGRRRVASKRLRFEAGRHTRRLRLGRRHVRALAARREALSIVAIDESGNRSAAKVVRLKVSRSS